MTKIAKRLRPESVSDAEWLLYYSHLGSFASLPSSLKEEARLIDLPARSTVFTSGDVANEMFFLLVGEIRLFRRLRTGGEIVLDLRRQNGFLAEHVLFQNEYDCDAVTLKASKVLTLPRIAFARVLRETDLGNHWIAYLAGKLRLARSRAERLALNTARERIIHFIGTFGTRGVLTLTQTKKNWAIEIGLTHEALYRELARMQKEGLLVVEYNKISLTRQLAHKIKVGRRD